MGTKLDLHHLHAPPPARVVSSSPVRRARPHPPVQLRLFGLLLLALFVIAVLRPVRVTLAGTTAVVPQGTTVARAAALLKLPAQSGNLVAVTGEVLRAAGGTGPTFLRNGATVTAKTRLHNGDSFACWPGREVVEPVRESVTLLKPKAQGGIAEPAVVGARRVQVGLISGKTLIETTSAMGTVPAVTGTSKPRVIALTFDDGPHPSQTPQILATLRKHNAKATFFVLGELVRYYSKTLKQTIADGHEIALHSWNHGNLARMSAGAIQADMARCRSALEPSVGKPIRIMRPPYGALSSTARSALKGAGYRIILWDVDTNDWRRPGADTIYSRIMNGAAPGRIVLCHDGGGPRSQTIAAIARAVPALQARGYRLVTVSQILGLQSLPQGGVILAAGQRWETKAIEPQLAVALDEQPLVLPEAPVEVGGQLMVPAKALLDGLGVNWQWSQAAQKLTVQGAMETLTLRLNSTKLEHQYGEAEQLPAAPVLYRGTLMVPLWVVLQSSGATALYDPAHSALGLLSLQKGLQSTELGQGPPPGWGKGIQWREYLKAGGR